MPPNTFSTLSPATTTTSVNVQVTTSVIAQDNPSISQSQSQTQHLANLLYQADLQLTPSHPTPFLSLRQYHHLQCPIMLLYQFWKLLTNLTTYFMLYIHRNKKTMASCAKCQHLFIQPATWYLIPC